MNVEGKKVLVTGGAGFIGSAVVRTLLAQGAEVANVDKLTYAGNLATIADCMDHAKHHFHKEDIADYATMVALMRDFQPDWVMHLAAESHVDRSIDSAEPFIQTNIVGTYSLLEAFRHYWDEQGEGRMADMRFLHVSTDEVFGTLGEDGYFTEDSPYQPNSPYSSSKAASDHLVRAWYHTYAMPNLVSNCSNNYGPYQFPEKLIPTVIFKAINDESIPIYGTGENVRDWLHVEDHARALVRVVSEGTPGETYNVGSDNERTNLEIVHQICSVLDELTPRNDNAPRESQISYVTDRPGHDFRYAIDASKLTRELNWQPQMTFEAGIRSTVQWYLDNRDWAREVAGGEVQQRLGLT